MSTGPTPSLSSSPIRAQTVQPKQRICMPARGLLSGSRLHGDLSYAGEAEIYEGPTRVSLDENLRVLSSLTSTPSSHKVEQGHLCDGSGISSTPKQPAESQQPDRSDPLGILCKSGADTRTFPASPEQMSKRAGAATSQISRSGTTHRCLCGVMVPLALTSRSTSRHEGQ